MVISETTFSANLSWLAQNTLKLNTTATTNDTQQTYTTMQENYGDMHRLNQMKL